MRLLRPIFAIALVAGSVGAFAQTEQNNIKVGPPVSLPAPAEALLKQAENQAQTEGKNVLVIFHASWCGWCHELDKFMTDPQYKPIFDDNFVTVKLTVLEDDKHKIDENPGGIEEMDVLGGRDAGLPLFAILDPSGKTIITSMRPIEGKDKGANTGFPAEPEEIDHFATMMQKGAPKITADQITAMKTYLTAEQAARKAAAAKSATGGGEDR
jgi:thioredoxin-related protein